MQGSTLIFLVSLLVGVAGRPKCLVLIDPFTSYLSGHCKSWCERNGVRVVEAVCSYQVAVLGAEGRVVPEALRAPGEGEEYVWCVDRGIISDGVSGDEEDSDSDSSDNDLPEALPSIDDVFVVSESEAGTGTAERMQIAIGAPGNGNCPQLRDKFEQNRRCLEAGMPANKQLLASTWKEAETFLDEVLWRKKSSGGGGDASGGGKSVRRNRKQSDSCIMKPNRGVATDGVYLCHSLEEASAAFQAIKGAATFGDVRQRNPHVLIQEYTPGSEEYAVDTVTCQGVTRVTALWKYEKVKANGYPFMYQCSELVDVEGDNERDSVVRRKVVDYAVQALQAQNLRYGACHTEIKVHPRLEQPRLMEVNARWHAQPFLSIMTRALGYDSIELTMEAMFESEQFLKSTKALRSRAFGKGLGVETTSTRRGGGDEDEEDSSDARTAAGGAKKDKDNHAPPRKTGAGAIVHLVQRSAGVVRAINAAAVEALPSVLSVSIDAQVGEEVPLTVDHRTHSGYVVMYAEDEAAFRRDYRRVLELQDSIVEVVTESRAQEEAPVPGERKKGGGERYLASSGARKREKKARGGRGLGRTSAKKEAGGVPDGDIEEGRGGADQENEDGTLASAVNRVLGLFPRLTRVKRMVKIAALTSSLGYAAAAAYITFLPEYE